MDILNFISWIKAGNYRTTLPTDVSNVLPIGAKDPSRDDAWLPLAVNAAPLQSLYNPGTVTQLTAITTAVTLNTLSGVITTVAASASPGSPDIFTFNNTNITTSSILLVSVSYPTSGTGVAHVTTQLANGSAQIVINTVDHGGAPLDSSLNIHFFIINPA
jgi:hypothetical protein